MTRLEALSLLSQLIHFLGAFGEEFNQTLSENPLSTGTIIRMADYPKE